MSVLSPQSLKARPARIRVALGDPAPPNAVRLALADWRSRPAAIVSGLMFLVFAAIDVSVIRGMSFRFDSVFDRLMMLFQE